MEGRRPVLLWAQVHGGANLHAERNEPVRLLPQGRQLEALLYRQSLPRGRNRCSASPDRRIPAIRQSCLASFVALTQLLRSVTVYVSARLLTSSSGTKTTWYSALQCLPAVDIGILPWIPKVEALKV